jgi:hypothetical protein
VINSDNCEAAFPVACQPEADRHFAGEGMLAERKLALVPVAVDDWRLDERFDFG